MTIENAIKILKDGRENLYGASDKSVPYEQQYTLVALDISIKSLEADRTIEKTLYAIREEMQYIKVAELQIYGANSWRFSNAIEEIINKHLKEVQDGDD